MASKAIAAWVLLAAVFAGGKSVEQKTPRPASFRWNWHETQRAEKAIEETAALTREQRKELVTAIYGSLTKEGGWTQAELDRMRQDAPDTRIKLIDLNGDGVPEVIAQASGNFLCGATGNCDFWIFRRVSGHYEILLQAIGIQGFTIEPTSTNGFRDLVLAQHESADRSNLFFYTFSKGGYHETACYEALLARAVGGDLVELKDPVITPCGQ